MKVLSIFLYIWIHKSTCPSVRGSVGSSVGRCVTSHVFRLLGATYAVYVVLVFLSTVFWYTRTATAEPYSTSRDCLDSAERKLETIFGNFLLLISSYLSFPQQGSSSLRSSRNVWRPSKYHKINKRKAGKAGRLENREKMHEFNQKSSEEVFSSVSIPSI